MFIDAAQLTQNRAPSDAGSMAIQTAIRQQKEFEEALKLAQERREAEAAAAERAKAEVRKQGDRQEMSAVSEHALSDGVANSEATEVNNNSNTRGVSVDVEV